MRYYPLILLLVLTVSARSQLKITINVTNSSCGVNNGSLLASGSNGAPPYTYLIWGQAGNDGNFTSLRPGEYFVTVKDVTGSTATGRVVITNTSFPPVPSFNIIHPTSCDKFDGRLTVIISGGFPPFQYSLDELNYQSSNVFTNLSHGTYQVYVKDVNGCRNAIPAPTFLHAPNCINTIRVSGTYPRCGDNGKLSVIDPLPGIAPRKYSLDGINYQDSPAFTNLPPGLYTIRIKDATGFVRLFSIALTYNCTLQLSLDIVAPVCGNTNGSITAKTINGEGPYEYSIDGGAFQTSNKFEFLQAGTYLVKVRDVKGLTVSMSAFLDNTCSAVTTNAKGATCGLNNGEIEATGSGGMPPYEYSIDGTNFQAANRFTGLAAASYTIFMKDAVGRINTTTALISGQAVPQLSSVVTAATCEDNDGSITAATADGLAPLVYSITPASFHSSPVFENLASGNYKLLVKDGNGCTASVDVIVPLKNSVLLTLNPEVTICEGNVASLKVTSNASMFEWSPGPGITNPAIRDQNVRPVTTTQYTVTATQGKCTKSEAVIVIVKAAPRPDAGKDQIICYGEDARLEGNGGLLFNWTPAMYLNDKHSRNPISVKPASTVEYSLTVTDAAGCSSVQPDIVKITVTTPKVFAGHDTSVLVNQPFHLKAVDIDNSGFIEYKWQPSTGLSNADVADPVSTLERNTTYRVIARTISGCEASDEVNVQTYKAADIYVPNAFTPNWDGHNDYAKPILVGIKELTNFTIFNRWGGIVYRFTPGSRGWDGLLNGILQSTASFTWIVEGIDFRGTTIKRYGTIMLIR